VADKSQLLHQQKNLTFEENEICNFFIYFSFLKHSYIFSQCMQLNEETLEKDKKWVPDLQLSLSQTNSNNDGKSDLGFRETKEINTKLSLS
jgi:hypothetical protein